MHESFAGISVKTRGFTLIELVVVITILAILSTVAASKFIDIQSSARASTYLV